MSAASLAITSDLDQLCEWVEGVSRIPRFLRTREARDLFDALAGAGLTEIALLRARGKSAILEVVATELGRSRDALAATLKKCPFGIG